jgi:hypothetical protein
MGTPGNKSPAEEFQIDRDSDDGEDEGLGASGTEEEA